MARILVTRPMPGKVGAIVRELGEVEMRDSNAALSDAELRRALAEFDIVLPTLGDMFTAEVFADVRTPRARLLANFGMGYNHIDVAAAHALGIAVTNTPGAVTDATADIGMLLILMTCRRGGEGERMVRAGQWTGWHPTQMLGLHVTGKTLGIVGWAISARRWPGAAITASGWRWCITRARPSGSTSRPAPSTALPRSARRPTWSSPACRGARRRGT